MERDRDADGRPRNARPRDGLGRPLPYGVRGEPREGEGVVRTPDETLDAAQAHLDAGRPFHAHEVFEDAWKTARDGQGSDADLWRALAQLAVGITHRLRDRPVGAQRLLTRAAANLGPYGTTTPHGIDVDALVGWAENPDAHPMPALRVSDGRGSIG